MEEHNTLIAFLVPLLVPFKVSLDLLLSDLLLQLQDLLLFLLIVFNGDSAREATL
jgi:hypothetical protein